MRDFIRFPGLIRELEALDTVFRMDMDMKQRRAKSPWIMEGRSGLRQEEDAVWDRLYAGLISEDEALEEITTLMKVYYGK